jgi:hypothetical protein
VDNLVDIKKERKKRKRAAQGTKTPWKQKFAAAVQIVLFLLFCGWFLHNCGQI